MRRVLGTPAYARSRYEDLDGLLVVAGDGGPSDLCGGEREREREISLFLRGYRYALRDQDTTWPAAC